MPTRKDADGRWHAEVCVGRKRLHRRLPAGATASDAKRLEAELTKALHAQKAERVPTIPGDPLLTEIVGAYTEGHADTLRSPDTAKFHAYRIGKWLEGRRVSETREVSAEIVADLKPVYAAATINRSLGALKKALSLAWERGITHTDYSSLVKRLPEHNQRTTHLSMEQVDELASHASEQVRAAIWIALYTGCRRGEILKMQAKDIAGETITIHAGNTKTLKTRTVPIVPPLRPWLAYVPLTINFEGLKSGFRRAREACGMPDVTFHDLRRSCGTLMIQAGVDLYVVSRILGHSSVKVTQDRYAHLHSDQMRDGLAKTFRAR